MKQIRATRNSHGQIAESAVGLWLVVIGLIFGTLVLLDAASVAYNKIKLGFIANQIASYASIVTTTTPNSNALITTYAGNTLQAMGYKPGAITVAVSTTTILTRPAVNITLSGPVSSFLLIKLDGVLPSQFTLTDSAVAVLKYWYWGDGELINPFGGSCTYALANPDGTIPNDGLPAWQVTLYSMSQIR